MRRTLTVLANACMDADEEVRRVRREKVFPRTTKVLIVMQWVDQISR